MAKAPSPKFDFGAYTPDFVNLFQGFVNNITDPQLEAVLAQLAADALQVTITKASGASDEEVARVDASLRARAQSVAGVPGLIIAGREQAFMAFTNNLLTGLIGFGFAALRSAIPGAGLVAAAGAAATGSSKG